MRSHRWIDERSLALHDAVAVKLESQPDLLRVARANLDRWLLRGPMPALSEWQAIFDREPLAAIVTILRARTETARRLRQSSPFAGVLTAAERRDILSRYDPRRA